MHEIESQAPVDRHDDEPEIELDESDLEELRLDDISAPPLPSGDGDHA